MTGIGLMDLFGMDLCVGVRLFDLFSNSNHIHNRVFANTIDYKSMFVVFNWLDSFRFFSNFPFDFQIFTLFGTGNKVLANR